MLKHLLFVAGCFSFFFSCTKNIVEEEDIIVRFGDKTLTQKEVIGRIPVGIHPDDSIALFNSIVDNWIETEVLTGFAEKRLYDLSAIDKKTEEYRNRLIVSEYLRRLRESHNPAIEEEKIRGYYESHKTELNTEMPLVKGIFLKVSSSAQGREEIGRLLQSDSPDNIDLLEKNWLDMAISYEYFKDRWIDWETVSGLIPHRFSDPDGFLADNNYFEKEYGDCAYYLLISDYLPSGSSQPYEFASQWIGNLLARGEVAEYERTLVNSLVKKSIEENKLELLDYDFFHKSPMTRN